jgi:sugar lactone lactonase YvrE
MRTFLRSAALLAIGASPAAARPGVPLAPETVVDFDSSRFETPESVQFDHQGNLYVSLALTGEIRKIAPDGTQTTVAYLPLSPEVQPCQNAFGLPIMGGIALDPEGDLFVSVGSCDLSQLGIWEVTPDGSTALLAPLPPEAQPNGIAYRAGQLYVADTSAGQIWRVAADGATPPEVWASSPLLVPFPDFFPGPNGLQIFRDEVYVSVSDHYHVVAFPIVGKKAGPPRIHAQGVGLDDFAFDVRGNLYGTTDPFNTLVRIAPDGTVETLLTADDGLDGPTSAVFGVRGDNKNLYVANGAFPFFSTTHRARILRVNIGVPGMPR